MRVSILLFIAYVLVLFKLLFFKITLNFSDISISGNEKTPFSRLWAASNFIPFYRIYYYASGQEPYLVGLLNVAGNILIFVPMGFFLPYFFKGLRRTKSLLLVIVLMSLSIETLQILTSTGEFDVDDVILNTVGAMVGYFLFVKGGRLVGRKKRPKGDNHGA
jgi:glycopeptide antibiotics resistance protein